MANAFIFIVIAVVGLIVIGLFINIYYRIINPKANPNNKYIQRKNQEEQKRLAEIKATSQSPNPITENNIPEPLIITEPKAKEQSASKSNISEKTKVPVVPVTIQSTFETDEYILSSNKKTLQKGKDVEFIHIPLGVEVIQDKAFSDLKNIKEVIIPNGVKKIGNQAFSHSSIEKVIIPSTVQRIGDYAFSYCAKLKDVEIAEGVKSLGISKFEYCDSLEKVSLPTTITRIPDSFFDGCRSLIEVNIPENVSIIGDEAFQDCSSLPVIHIPESVFQIGISAFRDCSKLRKVVIPSKVVGLSEMLFYDDYNLETVILPDNLTCIMQSVFHQCSKLKIKIPLSVTKIMDDAFNSCYDMQIEVPKGKKEWIESILENFKGQISEYNYEEEYVLTKEIEERTKLFLDRHTENLRRRAYMLLNDDDYCLYYDNSYIDDYYNYQNELHDDIF